MLFNPYDKIIVIKEHHYDGAFFKPGMTGTVLEFDTLRQSYVIEWDHYDIVFHTCKGKIKGDRGFFIMNKDASRYLLPWDPSTRPLPDDPHKREIILKIHQLEWRFKNRHLLKKENVNEVSQAF